MKAELGIEGCQPPARLTDLETNHEIGIIEERWIPYYATPE